jgi:hypothetical protein
MQAISSDMCPGSSALLTFPQGNAAGTFFWLIELKEFSFFGWLVFQLL